MTVMVHVASILGAVHERVEGGDRLVSGDPEGDPARVCRRWAATSACISERAPRGAEGQRRSIFLRYLGVARAVSVINGVDREKLYEQLLAVAKKTAEADVKLDGRGKPIRMRKNSNSATTASSIAADRPGLAGSHGGFRRGGGR